MYLSKAHLLSEIQEKFDKEEVVSFAKEVATNPLCQASIRTSGSKDQIIESLMDAPKAVLERTFEDFFDEDEDEDNYDPDSFDSDSEEDSSDHEDDE